MDPNVTSDLLKVVPIKNLDTDFTQVLMEINTSELDCRSKGFLTIETVTGEVLATRVFTKGDNLYVLLTVSANNERLVIKSGNMIKSHILADESLPAQTPEHELVAA